MNIDERYHLAFKYYQEGYLQKAADILIESYAVKPDNVEALLYLAAICSELNNYDLAMSCIDNAIEIKNKSQIYKNALETDPDSASLRETISLCMIVKNEEKNLSKFLFYIKPIVHEIIIVDTGSTDRTKKIAQAFGAKVFDFNWTNDFSEARNYSLSKAGGKWILVLDADELISFKDHDTFKNLPEKSPSHSIAFLFEIRNYVTDVAISGWRPNDGNYLKEETSKGCVTDKIVRLFPNNQYIRFVNPVHERIEPSLMKMGIKIRESNVIIHHYGYLDTEKQRGKSQYYYDLGRIRLEERGTQDVPALYELALEASNLKKYEEALEYLRKVIDVAPNFVKANYHMGRIYYLLGKYEDAKVLYKKAVDFDPNLTDASLMHAVCEIYTGNAETAIHILEELLQKTPADPRVILALAEAHSAEGKKLKE
jgi:O-antigen biosynthesis protein